MTSGTGQRSPIPSNGPNPDSFRSGRRSEPAAFATTLTVDGEIASCCLRIALRAQVRREPHPVAAASPPPMARWAFRCLVESNRAVRWRPRSVSTPSSQTRCRYRRVVRQGVLESKMVGVGPITRDQHLFNLVGVAEQIDLRGPNRINATSPHSAHNAQNTRVCRGESRGCGRAAKTMAGIWLATDSWASIEGSDLSQVFGRYEYDARFSRDAGLLFDCHFHAASFLKAN